MKKPTNKLNLPAPLYKALCNDSYSPGESDYTATGLIAPARIEALKILHKDNIQEDASDLIYSLQGQSVHTILERAAEDLKSEGWIAETRFYHIVDGKKVGAQIDVFHPDTGLLQDYKLTSVYKVKDGITEEFAQQMNIQAELLRRNGYEIKKMEIVAILRDWSKGEREREVRSFGEHASYPANQVVILDVPLIPSEEVVEFIRTRINAHESARNGTLPQCSAEERWAQPDKWAVMKWGQKKAVSLHNSQEAAELVANSLHTEGKPVIVQKRPGTSRRCESYCPVAKFCTQYKKLKGDNS